jgi:hypothetical protein
VGILVHQNIRVSDVIVFDILDSDHLPIVFYILDHVKFRNLSTSKVTLSDINNDIPELDRLLKHKENLRKLWQETRDLACKAAVNRATKEIRRMTRKKEFGVLTSFR